MSTTKGTLFIGNSHLNLTQSELTQIYTALCNYTDKGQGDEGWQSNELDEVSTKVCFFLLENV
jgi:hypothetical protein